MEIPMDIPNLCANSITNADLMNNVGLTVPTNGNHSIHSGAHSDLNSDLDCSDVDFDSDSQLKPRDVDDKLMRKNENLTCAKLKKLLFARVSTDSTETDCSIDFKTHVEPNMNLLLNERANETILADCKSESSMDCDSTKNKEKLFDDLDTNTAVIVQHLVTSMDNVEVSKPKEQTTIDDAIALLTNTSDGSITTTDCMPVSTTVDTDNNTMQSTENP